MTVLDIKKKALALLPHDPELASASGSAEAAHLTEHWDAARKAVLTAREWGWLVRETPACCGVGFGEAFCYERPPDAIRVIGLCAPDGRRLKADAVNGGFRSPEPVYAIRYLPDSPDPNDWPPAVQDAVAAELAARIAPVITDNPSRSAELRRDAVAALEEAGRQDAQEVAYDGSDPNVFVHARL